MPSRQKLQSSGQQESEDSDMPKGRATQEAKTKTQGRPPASRSESMYESHSNAGPRSQAQKLRPRNQKQPPSPESVYQSYRRNPAQASGSRNQPPESESQASTSESIYESSPATGSESQAKTESQPPLNPGEVRNRYAEEFITMLQAGAKIPQLEKKLPSGEKWKIINSSGQTGSLTWEHDNGKIHCVMKKPGQNMEVEYNVGGYKPSKDRNPRQVDMRAEMRKLPLTSNSNTNWKFERRENGKVVASDTGSDQNSMPQEMKDMMQEMEVMMVGVMSSTKALSSARVMRKKPTSQNSSSSDSD